jgi:hypothetical protein
VANAADHPEETVFVKDLITNTKGEPDGSPFVSVEVEPGCNFCPGKSVLWVTRS